MLIVIYPKNSNENDNFTPNYNWRPRYGVSDGNDCDYNRENNAFKLKVDIHCFIWNIKIDDFIDSLLDIT